MRISITSIPSPNITKNGNFYSFQLPIIISINDSEEAVVLKEVNFRFGNDLSSFELFEENNQLISEINLKSGENKRLILRYNEIPHSLSFIKNGKLKSFLKFKFLSLSNEDIIFDFKLTARLSNNSENVGNLIDLNFARVARRNLFANLFLILLILLTLNTWIGLNDNVFGQKIPPITFNILLTSLTLFLGINLGRLRDVFTTLKLTKDFFNTTEIYFKRDTIRLLSNWKSFVLLLVTFTGLSYALLWLFLPLPANCNSELYRPYLRDTINNQNVLIDSDKVYWKNVDELSYTLKARDGHSHSNSELIRIGSFPKIDIPLKSFIWP